MININCGVLGHVDSGKTTLSRALSQIGSTASFRVSAFCQFLTVLRNTNSKKNKLLGIRGFKLGVFTLDKSEVPH